MKLEVFEGYINDKGPYIISLYDYGKNRYSYHIDGDYSQIIKITGTIVKLQDGYLLKGKNNEIVFKIQKVLFETKLNDIQLKKGLSESEIRDTLYSEKELLQNILNINDITLLNKEYVLQGVGRIDILCKLNDTFIIIELKKTKSNFGSVDQCLRYVNHFQEQGLSAIGYVLTKSATIEHIDYAKSNSIELIKYNID